MIINDFFSNTIDYILEKFNVEMFEESEQENAKNLYNCVLYFEHPSCFINENMSVFSSVNINSLLVFIESNINPLIKARLYTYLFLNEKNNKKDYAIRSLEYYIKSFNLTNSFEYKYAILKKIIFFVEYNESSADEIKKIIHDYLRGILASLEPGFDRYYLDINQLSFNYGVIQFDEFVSRYKTLISKCECLNLVLSSYTDFLLSKIKELKLIKRYQWIYKELAITIEKLVDKLNDPYQKIKYYKIALSYLKEGNLRQISEFQSIRMKIDSNQNQMSGLMETIAQVFQYDILEKEHNLNEKEYIKFILNIGYQPQINKKKSIFIEAEEFEEFEVNIDHINSLGKTICYIDGALDRRVEEIVKEANIFGRIILNILKKIKEKNINFKKDIDEIVDNCRFILDSRKSVVKKGFYHGFDLDFESALGILTPQMECFIRELASSYGESKYKINDKNIDEVNGLEYFLKKQNKLNQNLDEDIYFGLCVVFFNECGFNFRNNFAHGIIDDFNSYQCIYVWWLYLYFINYFSKF